MAEKYYTKREAAEILGVHERTIGRYLNAGRLKGARLGKAWKISESDISTFYETAKQETTEAIVERLKNTKNI